MSNESNHEDVSNPQKQTGHSESRRRFSHLGLAAPVVLSLVSKPVLGAQCLSNMMSGNLSNPDRGTCSLGESPGGWKNPGGLIKGYSHLVAWTAAGFEYGKLKNGETGNKWDDYIEGATTETVPFNSLLSTSLGIPLRQFLIEHPDELDSTIIIAYLNARLSEYNSSAFRYALTSAQVTTLAGGGDLPKPYADLRVFLSSTW